MQQACHVINCESWPLFLTTESVALYYVNAAKRCIRVLCPISVHHYKVNIYLSAPSNSEIK